MISLVEPGLDRGFELYQHKPQCILFFMQDGEVNVISKEMEVSKSRGHRSRSTVFKLFYDSHPRLNYFVKADYS